MTEKCELREQYLTAVRGFLADDWDIYTDDTIESAIRATEATRLEVLWAMLDTLERITSESRMPGPLLLAQLAASRLESRGKAKSAAELRDAISRIFKIAPGSMTADRR